MNKRETDGERITRAHGGTYSHGRWSRASGIASQMGASLLANALTHVHYQVRRVEEDAKGSEQRGATTWGVIFR